MQMITQLLSSGKASTAKELAQRTELAIELVQAELAALLQSKAIRAVNYSGHRYYLMTKCMDRQQNHVHLLANYAHIFSHIEEQHSFSAARTCYHHIAGKLGVSLTRLFIAHGLILFDEEYYWLTEAGKQSLTQLKIISSGYKITRLTAKPCLDCTEREFHLAGQLGNALLSHLLANQSLLKSDNNRILLLTRKGKNYLLALMKAIPSLAT